MIKEGDVCMVFTNVGIKKGELVAVREVVSYPISDITMITAITQQGWRTAFDAVEVGDPLANIGQIQGVDAITCTLYWDCECETDYIHPKLQFFCSKCGSQSIDQPDSRVMEVLQLWHNIYHS